LESINLGDRIEINNIKGDVIAIDSIKYDHEMEIGGMGFLVKL